MSRIFSAIIISLLVVMVIVFITGYFTDPSFEGREDVILDYSPSEVWRVLTDVKSYSRTKNFVSSVEVLATYRNLVAWREHTSLSESKKYRMVEYKKEEYLKIEMVESSIGMTGIWEFILEPDGKRTRLIIVENSEISSVLVRGIRFYFNRGFELNTWVKSVRIGLFNSLLSKS